MDYYDLKKNEAFLVSTRAFIEKDGRVLMIRVPKFKGSSDMSGKWNGKWSTPGGLVEMNEEFVPGLLREIKEETGIKVRVRGLFGVGEMFHEGFVFKDKRKANIRCIELGYKCEYLSGKVSLSEEHSEYKWVNKPELLKLAVSPDTEDLVMQYINRID